MLSKKIKSQNEHKCLLNRLKNNDNSIQKHYIKGVKLTDSQYITCEIGYYMDKKSNRKHYFCHNQIIKIEDTQYPLNLFVGDSEHIESLFCQVRRSLIDLIKLHNRINQENQITNYTTPLCLYAVIENVPISDNIIHIKDKCVYNYFYPLESIFRNHTKLEDVKIIEIDIEDLLKSNLCTEVDSNIESETRTIYIRVN